MAAALRPAQEHLRCPVLSLDVPAVEVALAQRRQRQVVLVEPGEQLLSLAERFGGVVAGAGRQGRPALRGVQLRELVPGEELAQQSAVVAVAVGGQPLSAPSFEEHDLPVDGGQCAAGHEQVAQVRCGAPAVELVQSVVGQRDLAEGEGLQVAGQPGVVVQPVERPVALGHGQQAVGQRLQFGVDPAAAVVEQLLESGA